MKTNQNIQQVNEAINPQYTSPMITASPRSRYSHLLGSVSFMPSSRAQAINHINHINTFGVDNLLMAGQHNAVEALLNQYGFSGQYTLTKSGTMCRLENVKDYVSALTKKFDL